MLDRSKMEEPTARRFALKYDPPTVILEYRTSEGLFHYRMRIKNLTPHMVRERVRGVVVARRWSESASITGPRRRDEGSLRASSAAP